MSKDTAEKIISALAIVDPNHEATIVIAAGPTCHDYSRMRTDAPGREGVDGSKFVRLSQLVEELKSKWGYAHVLVIENVVPNNKADVSAFEKSLQHRQSYQIRATSE